MFEMSEALNMQEAALYTLSSPQLNESFLPQQTILP
jgi:hypothetical protein